jgi:lipid-binding SYLF domain-containing protein
MQSDRRTLIVGGLSAAVATAALTGEAHADAANLAADSRRALDKLYSVSPRARRYGHFARGIMVFPTIIKGGFVFGASTGDGTLFEHGRPVAFFNISSASFGLQIGGQAFSYALFFETRGALDYIHKSDGWALGTGPNVVVVNQGAAAEADTEIVTHDVYAVPFGAKGLMAGLDIKGTKITRIHPH